MAKPRSTPPPRPRYKIPEFRLIGFAMENALAGTAQVKIQTSAALTSDHPGFHHCLRGFADEIDAQLRLAGHRATVRSASNFALVIDPDQSATLHLDSFPVELEMIAKRNVERGDHVFLTDIGDIRRGAVSSLKLKPEQRLILCLRCEWKFLLFFHLTPDTPLNLDSLGGVIGMGLRRLLFERLYRSLEDSQSLSAMIGRGWFPFNAILGPEYDRVHQAVVDDFNLEAVELDLVAAFDKARIDTLIARWWHHPQFAARRPLLEEGVSLFLEQRPIPAVKTLMSEIEGILRERHVPRSSGRQGMEKILETAFDEVLQSAGGDMLYFPVQFVEYLRGSIFASFDPTQPSTEATRNTVGHGRAAVSAYTARRALQTILVLDQIFRFLTLPIEPANKD